MQIARAGLALALVFVAAAGGAQSAKGEGPEAGGARVAAERFLDNLVGEWQISRKIRGTVVHNTLQATWVLRHRFVQLHMRDVKEPSEYEALVLVGYEEKTERFVAYWCDSFGPDYAAPGFGKRRGNAIEFVFNYADGPFHNTFTWDPKGSKWTLLMESEKDGARVVFAEDTVTRK
ncbi:MAG: DUF1579 family protein [Vicinamibacteria bacterium]|nr:DUF1579 family protein [Vicinamibacteria bacterium]